MSRIKNARGQGSVEYVLILALAVAIVLGAIYQLNSAFKVFANNYFGEYLACLLETGELPSLGSPAAEGICAAEFKPFSLADGAPKTGEPIGSGNGPGGGGGEPDPSDVKNVSGRGGSGNATVAEGNQSASMSGANGRRGIRTRVRRGGGINGGSEGGDAANGSGTAPSAFADGYDSNRGVRSPIRYPTGSGRRRAQLDEDENKRTKVTTTAANSRRKEDEAKLFKARKPAAAVDDGDAPVEFGIGNFLRYLIMIIIIIAIVVFIGGQALQVSKST